MYKRVLSYLLTVALLLSCVSGLTLTAAAEETETPTVYSWNGNAKEKTQTEGNPISVHFEDDDWMYFQVPDELKNVNRIGVEFTLTIPEGETQDAQHQVLFFSYQANDGTQKDKDVFVGVANGTKTVSITLDNADFQNSWNWEGSFRILRGNYWARAAGYYLTKIDIYDLTDVDTVTNTDPTVAKWDIGEWDSNGLAVSAVERENDTKASWLWFKVTSDALKGAHDNVGVRVTYTANNPYTQVLLDDGEWHTVDNVGGGTSEAIFALENVNFANDKREGDSSFRLLVGDYGWNSQSAMYLQSVELYLTGNKTALQAAVNGAKNVSSGYTTESATAYAEALTAARAVLNNPLATQTEVDAALSALNAADAALVEGTGGYTPVDPIPATEIVVMYTEQTGYNVVDLNNNGCCAYLGDYGSNLEFTVPISDAGRYDIDFYVGYKQSDNPSWPDSSGFNFTVDGDFIDTAIIPSNNDWYAFQAQSISSVDLTQGTHTLKMTATGPYTFQKMVLRKQESAPVDPSPSSPLIDRVTTYGRTFVQNGSIFLFWSNSGVSFTFNGTGATANLSVNNTAALFRGYLQVYVDGEFMPSRTIELSNSQNSALVLAEGLKPGTHTIELRKRNEAVYGNSATIAIKDIAITDGEFLDPPAAPTRVIEFVGDSLTTGFGNMRTDGSGDVDANGDIIYSTGTQNGTMSYAVLAAKELGAEANIIARSGIHYAKRTQDNIYDHYTNTATLPSYTSGSWVSNTAWDFEAHPNDVVVINLGSNDHHQPYTNEAFTEDAVAMIQLVREKNPNAVIIWTYGFGGDIIGSALQAAVKQVNDAGDNKVYYYNMAGLNVTTEGVGTHGHPTIQAHINRSIGLAEFIAEKAGWEVDATPFLNAQIAVSGEYAVTEDALAGYTSTSAKAFTDAIAAGEALIQAGNGTKEQLLEAADTIWKAQLGLVQLEDVSAEYITVENYDTLNGLSSGSADLETEDYREGAGAVSKSGSSGTVAINKSGYNISMPEDLENWYLEFWLYVDHPESLPTESCIEISQTMDVIEQQWSLRDLGLVSGWNKVQLKLTAYSQFRTLQNVRCFLVNVQSPITIKLDNLVIARGKVAADTEEWSAAIAAAEEKLAAGENTVLSAALKLAKAAVTQADVDAFTAILKKAMEAEISTAMLGDVDGDGEITSTDARLTLQYYADKIEEDDLDITVADVDGDGEITSTDARLILQYYAGKIPDWPTNA